MKNSVIYIKEKVKRKFKKRKKVLYFLDFNVCLASSAFYIPLKGMDLYHPLLLLLLGLLPYDLKLSRSVQIYSTLMYNVCSFVTLFTPLIGTQLSYN